MHAMAHVEIEGFSTYRAVYTWKMPSKSRTYAAKQSRMRPCSRFLKCSNDSNLNLMCRMVLEWREREHGDVEEVVCGDLMAQ